MRKRFEQQLKIGQRLIEDLPVGGKNQGKLEELIIALKAVYCNTEYNERIFSVLENFLTKDKQRTGRRGLDLWPVFVLAQVRMCLNTSYEWVHDLANNHFSIRWLMGVETDFGYEKIQYSYQRIYDNVSLLPDEALKELNAIVVEFGHNKVFKKKKRQPCA